MFLNYPFFKSSFINNCPNLKSCQESNNYPHSCCHSSKAIPCKRAKS
nr:MAG TPA: hypothetical protein [Caudoviricetes sp.]